MLMFIAAAAAAGAPLPEPAKPDAQCLVVYMIASGMVKSDEERLQAFMGTAYFYGRIEAAVPNMDLTATLRDTGLAIEKLEEAKIKALGDACDKRIEVLGQRFTSAGQALQE